MTVIDSVSNMFDQINEVISVLNDEEFNTELKLFNGSSIGAHIRHIYDFYECVILAEEKIDYTCRKRNPEIEKFRLKAQEAYYKLLQNLPNINPKEKVKVIGDFSYQESDNEVIVSTFGRELMYAFDHSVHHLAIIKMGIRAHFSSIKIDNDLGVAPSTIRYIKSL
jgi:uncharacterized damage-inducible protein DinB